MYLDSIGQLHSGEYVWHDGLKLAVIVVLV